MSRTPTQVIYFPVNGGLIGRARRSDCAEYTEPDSVKGITHGKKFAYDNRFTERQVHITVTAGEDDINVVPTANDKPAKIDYSLN